MCRPVDDDVLLTDDGVDTIIKFLYKRDALSVINALFEDFRLLLSTKLADNELFMNFEMRFSAQISRYSAHGYAIAPLKCIIALSLLVNSNVSDFLRAHWFSQQLPQKLISTLIKVSPTTNSCSRQMRKYSMCDLAMRPKVIVEIQLHVRKCNKHCTTQQLLTL